MSARPVKLAFLLPHLRPGGAEKAVVNWCRHLDRRQCQPFVMLKQRDGAFLADLPDDVQVIDLGGRRSALLPFAIARVLAEHRIDIAYSATNAMNLALLAAPSGKTRRFVSEHTSPNAYLAEAKWRALRRAAMRLLYPRAAGILVPASAIADELSALLPGTAPPMVVPNPLIEALHADHFPNPVQPEPVEGREPQHQRAAFDRLRLNGDGFEVSSPQSHIVSAGRLVSAKGYDVLIAACTLLANAGTEFRLDIFGEGPLRDVLQRQIELAGLALKVTLKGHSNKLATEMANADLFVLASRREGFGNVIVEAMAVCTPVIATDCPGPASLIRHGETGLLVPREDAAALADAIMAVISDPDAAHVRAQAALATVAPYEVSRSAAALLAALTPHD